MSEKLLDMLVSEQKQTNFLLREFIHQVKKMQVLAPSQVEASVSITIEFLPLVDLTELAAGTDVLLLMRDFWQGYDEILNAQFDGEHFRYRGREVKPTSAIAGWAALPYKLPYAASDPRFKGDVA